MALNDHDQARIREYLLGQLSDEEQEKLEERLMIDEDLFQELEVSKDELIEEYCAGELSRTDHKWFEQHYLTSQEGRTRHKAVVAINSLKPRIPPRREPSWLERLQAFINAHRWAVAAATSAAVLIVAGLLIFRPAATSAYAFALTNSISQRSQGNVRYFKVPLRSDIGELRITLQLPEGVARGSDYRVELDDRREIESFKSLSHDTNSVTVVIPAASLHEGLYALRLYALRADGTDQLIPGEYLFELVNSAQLPATPKPE